MMGRSKKAALTIRCATSVWTPIIIEQLENALTQMSRVQTIHLTLGAQSTKLRRIFTSLSQPAPLLEEVSLSDINYAMHDPDKSLPQDAFTEVPRLRSIELERLKFTWQAAIFKHHTVTSLRLKFHYSYPAYITSTLGQMLDALANMPHLRILDLDYAIPLHTTTSRNENVVQLKFLEKISIKARADDCNHFLRCIHYPPNVGIALHCHANRVTEYAPIVSIVGQALRRTRDTDLQLALPHTLQEAVITSYPRVALDINLYNKVNRRQTNPSLDENPCVSIRIEGNHYVSGSENRLLEDIFASFDFLALKKLTLTCCQDSSHIRRDLGDSRVPENMENLVNILMQRSDMDAPIERLILDNCHGVLSRKELAVEGLENDGEDDKETKYSDDIHVRHQDYWNLFDTHEDELVFGSFPF
ncbi:hypothetical protein AN958_11746 [Leucoagaricus sp. SymC.cos]|nr:hypothetical protein AN958_11746 [Leucoagaricus sp. SymC.cos]